MKINTVHGRCQKEMYLDFIGKDNIQDQKEMYLDFIGKDNIQDPIYYLISITTSDNRTHFCINKL